MNVKTGTLYLVPAPLDFGCDTQAPLQDALPSATLQTAARLTHWVCENAKSTRAYLKRIDALHPLALSLQQQQITELPREVHKKGDHEGGFDARPLLAQPCKGTTSAWSAKRACPQWPTLARRWCGLRTTWACAWCRW